MEIVTDFFTEIKERTKSPLIGSFAIAWFFINYRIPLALFFYKQEDLKLDKWGSYFQLVRSHESWWYMFVLPLIIAGVYTFGYPYIKQGVTVFIARRKLATEKQMDEDAENSTVNMERYLSLQKTSKEQQRELADLISEEKLIKDQNTSLKTQIDTLKDTHQIEIESITARFNAAKEQLDLSHINEMSINNASHEERVVQLSGDIVTANNDRDRLIQQIRTINTRVEAIHILLAEKAPEGAIEPSVAEEIRDRMRWLMTI